MIESLQNFDAWLSVNFPASALEQLLTPALFSLLIFCAVMGLELNYFEFNFSQNSPKNYTEFFLIFGLGVVGVLWIN